MLSTSHSSNRNLRSGFSLIEMLAAVAIIGIISFLALPNLIKVRTDSEKNMAIARAEAVNMAMATLVQTRGRTQASSDWTANSTNDLRYTLVAPYLSYAETTRTAYMPNGYTIEFPTAIDPLRKVTLKQGSTAINY
ncbi:prepilin-type N-terminal cleavage/methylation domain-containing protein [Roseimicrobium gellanilyticum]|uniref:Prepilin-type N-terminal cleavage/methylation domain-containing protein n=1 Tax=Roseimicrobium gellanilyticum TaxID=748857 RepID=A0A366H7G4_9BACT|nr:type II secretion system protein [Roseimicrobium gellanilyticum]RBP37381.1 prepilin-type N-terminal cleavage/methylation domain-containing protein [Roseimicrobium gellanilyticum]